MSEVRKELWAVLYDTEPDALCMVSEAARLSAEKDLVCRAWMLCDEMKQDDAVRLVKAGAQRITHLQVPQLDCNYERATRDFLVTAAETEKPAAILFLSTVFSRAVAPGVAALLNAGITADCTKLYWDEEDHLIQSRPAFGGRTQADILSRTLPAIATVRRGVFALEEFPAEGEIPLEHLELEKADAFCTILEHIGSGSPLDLSRAEIIVSGGAGMGDQARFDRLYVLADLMGGEVAASRGAVAAGFARYERQVGQTGTTVRPKWYLAFGISGAVQHLSGMMDSENIIAVNPDRKAPIHKMSNYSIYADAAEVIEEMIRKLS